MECRPEKDPITGFSTSAQVIQLEALGIATGEPELVSLRELRPADSPRLAGENGQHAAMLAEFTEHLPPIIVHRSTMRIVDGTHRFRAAQLRGESQILVYYFDGDEADAFRLAVTLNIIHGLPLTCSDRRAAAARILRLEPYLSDRSIARIAGLSPKTVGALRLAGESGESVRIGRDGRARPINSAHGRRLASILLIERPNASLRAIARSAGISAATARDVRMRLSRDEDPVPARLRMAEKGSRPLPSNPTEESGRTAQRTTFEVTRRRRDPAAILGNLGKDPTLRFSESGRALLIWLRAHIVAENECAEHLGSIPAHSAGMIAQLARDCAAEWLYLANRLEGSCDHREQAGPVPDVLREMS